MLYRMITTVMMIFMLISCTEKQTSSQLAVDWALPGMQFDVPLTDIICSVGYPAWDDEGNHYFITAGYCFRSKDLRVHKFKDPDSRRGLDVFDANDLNNPVGFEKVYFEPAEENNTFFDISLVQLYPGKKLQGSTVGHGRGGLGFRNIPHNISYAAEVGENVCLAARNRNEPDCNKVTRVHVDVPINRTPFSYRNLVNASYCSGYGDSGGAVYSNTEDKRRALGIHVAQSANDPCNSFYITIEDVMAHLHRHIPSLTIGS